MAVYADLLTIQTLNTGDVLTAALMTQVRSNDEFGIDPPACSVYSATPQVVPTGTASVALDAASEYFDNDAMHSTTTNTARITAQTAGRYLFVATVAFNNNGTGNRRMAFRVNAVTTYESTLVAAVTIANSVVTTAPKLLTLAAGDYVGCVVWQTSGVDLDVTLLEFGATYITR